VLAAALIGGDVRREPALPGLPGQALVTGGPFAFVRNPIYLANGALIVGSVLACGTLWLVPIALAWCAALYAAVVRYEEWLLARHYGWPYVDYLERALRWVPHRRKPAPRRQGCRHDRLGSAILAELHVPLVLLPALVKWLVSHPPVA
jgi:protein-S-isoprenylcysteine O-methyltransferase Ste14